MSARDQFLFKQVWYVKKGDNVEGPYPARLIYRYLLVGRLGTEDQISVDQYTWQRISTYPELIPPLLVESRKDPVARQRLMAVVRWENERQESFQQGSAPSENEQTGGEGVFSERRGVEKGGDDDNQSQRYARRKESERHRQIVAGRAIKRQRWMLGIVSLFLTAGVIAFVAYLPAPTPVVSPECDALPAPAINWNYCQFEGAFLKGADLTGAMLRNANFTQADLSQGSLTGSDAAFALFSLADLRKANLSRAELVGASFRNAKLQGVKLIDANLQYADFSGALIEGVDFSGAVLDKAIWIDRRVCGAGSVGVCVLR